MNTQTDVRYEMRKFELGNEVERWYLLSIASILCGCGLFGIINILFASGAKRALSMGDYGAAQSKITTAKTLCIAGYTLLAAHIVFGVIGSVGR